MKIIQSRAQKPGTVCRDFLLGMPKILFVNLINKRAGQESLGSSMDVPGKPPQSIGNV